MAPRPPGQRSAYDDLHSAYPRTKIPDKSTFENGLNQTEIANVLGVNKSTISRELQRNCGGRGYRPKQAHEKAPERRKQKGKAILCTETWHLIEEKLRLDWSREKSLDG